FDLLSRIQAPVSGDVVNILNDRYFPSFGQYLGDIIAKMRPTPELDVYWIIDLPKYQTDDRIPLLTNYARSILNANPIERATQISA
ncbi:hypothetical protein LI165_12580, partial [Phascolarctobacterium faecium]|uniref:hypothetical protein n=1 Tax=Phascolarctobacterium faecium TaxID=33025 RepID=UPI001D05CCD0